MSRVDDDPAEYMCPNCVTPWKCNGPHIPDEGPPNAYLTMDEAWAWVEAVLPEGPWYISNVRRRSPTGRFSASVTLGYSLTGESMSGFGATPAEALVAVGTRFTKPPFAAVPPSTPSLTEPYRE